MIMTAVWTYCVSIRLELRNPYPNAKNLLSTFSFFPVMYRSSCE